MRRKPQGLYAVVVFAAIAVGMLTAPAGAKPAFSGAAGDYIPARIAKVKVKTEPGPDGASSATVCFTPSEAVSFTPLVASLEGVEVTRAGIWDCPASNAPIGTGFVAGLNAVAPPPGTPALTAAALAAAGNGINPASVTEVKMKVGGTKLTVFRYQLAPPPGVVPGAVTTFEAASAQPNSGVLLTALTPVGTKAVPYLAAMLKAGASLTPRA